MLVARPSSFVLQLLFHRLPRQLAAFSCSVRPVLQLSLLANRSISSVVVNRSTHRRFDRPPLLSFSCRFVSFSTGRPHSIYVRRRSVSVFNQSTASHLSFSCLNRSTASSLVSWFLSVFQLSSLAVSTGRPHQFRQFREPVDRIVVRHFCPPVAIVGSFVVSVLQLPVDRIVLVSSFLSSSCRSTASSLVSSFLSSSCRSTASSTASSWFRRFCPAVAGRPHRCVVLVSSFLFSSGFPVDRIIVCLPVAGRPHRLGFVVSVLQFPVDRIVLVAGRPHRRWFRRFCPSSFVLLSWVLRRIFVVRPMKCPLYLPCIVSVVLASRFLSFCP